MKKNIGGQVPTNSADEIIKFSEPYFVEVSLMGTSDMLFHRWLCEYVEEKSKAVKGSKASKSDNIETFIYRNEEGQICIPGEYLRQAIIHAAKYKKDPRSPRKSAMDIYKAAIIMETTLSSIGKKKWDYEDRRRVVVQRNAITRARPAISKGWKATFTIQVLLPEYISEIDLQDTIQMAGRLIGLGDFRPTYGRFNVIKFSRLV